MPVSYTHLDVYKRQHLLSLINDILDMSRIESGKIHLEETEVSLSEVLHDLKTIISGQIHAKQLELYMDVMDVINEDVYCDKTRLNQVLLNLLSNAIKFTPAGGTVSVCLREYPGIQRGCELYEIRVKDNGIGMSQKFVQKIFSPFERERTSTVSRTQGLSLIHILWNWLQKLSEEWGIRWMLSRSTGRRKKNW